MLMGYGVSANTPWIIQTMRVLNSGNVLLSAETPKEDSAFVLEFKNDHPDLTRILKLTQGDKVHLIQIPGNWPIDAGGAQYRLKRGWPRSYKVPEGLMELKRQVTREVGEHSEWCYAGCEQFSVGGYRGQRIIAKRSAEEVQADYWACHMSPLDL